MPKKGILDGGPKQLRIRAEDEIELDVLGDFNDRDGDPIGIEITPNKPTPSTPNYNTGGQRSDRRDKSLDISKSDISDGQGNLTARLEKRLKQTEDIALRMSFSLKQQKAQALGLPTN
jgi:hypothetical protein